MDNLFYYSRFSLEVVRQCLSRTCRWSLDPEVPGSEIANKAAPPERAADKRLGHTITCKAVNEVRHATKKHGQHRTTTPMTETQFLSIGNKSNS